jgi:hypothetical protein
MYKYAILLLITISCTTEQTYTLKQIRPAIFHTCHSICKKDIECNLECCITFWNKLFYNKD